MIKDIIHDPVFLAQRSVKATAEDVAVADDLLDTLKANEEICVGLAANMIGKAKCIIVYDDNGKCCEMFNPEIIAKKDPYETEEGCLSLSGVRKTKRYKTIKVRWQTRDMQVRIKNFTGRTAQIIQHEIDHCNGILI